MPRVKKFISGDDDLFTSTIAPAESSVFNRGLIPATNPFPRQIGIIPAIENTYESTGQQQHR